jgi:hypothetical protein
MSRKGRSSLGGFGASLSALSLGRTSSPSWGEDDVWDSSSDSEDPPRGTSRSTAAAPAPVSASRPGMRSSSQSFAGSLGLASSPASTSAAAGSGSRPPARGSTSSSVVPTERSSLSSQLPAPKPPAPTRSASGSSTSSSWLPYRNGKAKAAQAAEVPLEAQELAYVSLGTGDDGPDTPGRGDDEDEGSEAEEEEGPVVKEELEEILLGARFDRSCASSDLLTGTLPALQTRYRPLGHRPARKATWIRPETQSRPRRAYGAQRRPGQGVGPPSAGRTAPGPTARSRASARRSQPSARST